MTTLLTILYLPIGIYRRFITGFDRKERNTYRLALAVLGAWGIALIVLNLMAGLF